MHQGRKLQERNKKGFEVYVDLCVREVKLFSQKNVYYTYDLNETIKRTSSFFLNVQNNLISDREQVEICFM